MGFEDVILEIVLICVFFVLGLIYLSGKCTFLIPKYHYISKDVKKRIDSKKLSRIFGLASIIASLSIGVMVAGGLLSLQPLYFLGVIMLVANVLFLFSKGNRTENFILPEEKNTEASKKSHGDIDEKP